MIHVYLKCMLSIIMQVDGLNEQLTKIEERKEKLQISLDAKSGLEIQLIDLLQKVRYN